MKTGDVIEFRYLRGEVEYKASYEQAVGSAGGPYANFQYLKKTVSETPQIVRDSGTVVIKWRDVMFMKTGSNRVAKQYLILNMGADKSDFRVIERIY